MAWTIGEQLPPVLLELLDGRDLASKVGRAFLVVGVDEQGWPHCAMLSYGEAVALDARTLRLGLWDQSSTTRHLRRVGKATLCLADVGGVYYLKGEVIDLGPVLAEPALLAKLEFRICQVLQDGDPNGEVASGISYRSDEPEEQLLTRWERQLEALRGE